MASAHDSLPDHMLGAATPQSPHPIKQYTGTATPGNMSAFSISVRDMVNIHNADKSVGLYVMNNSMGAIGAKMRVEFQIRDNTGSVTNVSVPYTWAPWEITNTPVETMLASQGLRDTLNKGLLLILNPYAANDIVSGFKEVAAELRRHSAATSTYGKLLGDDRAQVDAAKTVDNTRVRDSIFAAVSENGGLPVFETIFNEAKFAGPKLNADEVAFIRMKVQTPSVLELLNRHV